MKKKFAVCASHNWTFEFSAENTRAERNGDWLEFFQEEAPDKIEGGRTLIACFFRPISFVEQSDQASAKSASSAVHPSAPSASSV